MNNSIILSDELRGSYRLAPGLSLKPYAGILPEHLTEISRQLAIIGFQFIDYPAKVIIVVLSLSYYFKGS
jgi:hypothetical protein